MDYSQILAKEFNIKEQYATNIISLLDEGNTIPFIARYRKEMHGSMDDQLIREFSEKLEYLRNLDKRREEIRNLINEQELMKFLFHLIRQLHLVNLRIFTDHLSQREKPEHLLLRKKVLNHLLLKYFYKIANLTLISQQKNM